MLLHDTGVSSNVHDLHERTPLHLAARYGSSAIVEYLLDDCKADPNAKTDDGRTPLHYAAVVDDEERREVVRLLRDFGADPTVKDGRGRTARDLAQRRDLWDVSATLRRAEKRWEEEHHQNWFQRHGLKR
jgi:ankyrin repeat protein